MARRATRASVTCLPTAVRVALFAAVMTAMAASVGVGVGVAVAEPSVPRDRAFAWHAPTACPTLAYVRARIEARLDEALDLGDSVIAISIEHAGDGFAATIELRGAGAGASSDRRTLTAARCDELADAIAVIVAGVASARHARVEVEPIAPPSAATRAHARGDDAAEVDAEVESEPPPPRDDSWRFGARLSTIGGVGIGPELDIGGELVALAHHGSLMVELGGAQWAPAASWLVNDRGGVDHVAIGLTVATARVGWRSARLPLRAWLVAEVGGMSGTAVDAMSNPGGSGGWIAAGAGVGFNVPLTSALAAVATIEDIAAIERVQFTLLDGTSIYEARTLSTRASLGIEVTW